MTPRSERQAQGYRSIRWRLAGLLFTVALVPTLLIGLQNYVDARRILLEDVRSRLQSVRDLRRAEIERFLEGAAEAGLEVASLEVTERALRAFAAALQPDAGSAAFEGGAASGQGAVTPADREHDEVLRSFAARAGVRSLLLVEAGSRRVVYSTRRELDPGTRLTAPSLRHHALARVVAEVLEVRERLHVAASDLDHPLVEGGLPALFLGCLVDGRGADGVLGVLVLEVGVDCLNSITSFDGRWDRAGLGRTGEVLLVGERQDGDRTLRTLRSDSRLFREEPQRARELLSFLEQGEEDLATVQRNGSEALVRQLDSSDVSAGLAGREGVTELVDFRGGIVVSAYGPVTPRIPRGARERSTSTGNDSATAPPRWAILATQDMAEALGANRRLILNLLLTTGVLALLVGVVAFRIGDRTTRPIIEVIEMVREVASGNLRQKKLLIQSHDEVGILGKSVNSMLGNLNRIVERAEAVAEGRTGAGQVEERMRTGEDLESAAAIRSFEAEAVGGDLGVAFSSMERQLRVLTVQARLIASDKLEHPALDLLQEGELGAAFGEMTRRLRDLASQAGHIARGDLSHEFLKDEGEGDLSGAFARMVQSLRLLSKQAESIAAGRLDDPVLDEAVPGDLGTAFSTMVDSLRGLLGLSRDLGARTVGSASELRDTSEELREASSFQSEQVAEMRRAMTTLASAITQVAAASAASSELSRSASESSRGGLAAVQQAGQELEEIRSVSEASGRRMLSLVGSVKQVEKAVSVIQEIAEQTNFLALNAAIEAARAGQHGRGFAVVADEVRKLAERSAGAAQEVHQLADAIRGEMEAARDAAERSMATAARGHETARSLVSTFERIDVDVSSAHAAFAEISTALDQQMAVSDEVAASIEKVEAASRRLDGVSEKIVEQSNGQREIASRLDEAFVRYRV